MVGPIVEGSNVRLDHDIGVGAQHIIHLAQQPTDLAIAYCGSRDGGDTILAFQRNRHRVQGLDRRFGGLFDPALDHHWVGASSNHAVNLSGDAPPKNRCRGAPVAHLLT